MSTLLEIKDLRGGYEKEKIILHDNDLLMDQSEAVDVVKDGNILQGINLIVEKGESVGIIGLNGSGKSTLGKAIMNMIPYREGSIIFNGQHVENKSTHELAQLGIAIMHQGGIVFPNLSIWHNLQVAFGKTQHSTFNNQLQDIIPLLQRPKKELVSKMANKLSGGERHELALAMTLARRPKLVILDEPSAGLSPRALENTYTMLGLFREKSSITFLVIEQNISKAVAFCSRCLLLDQGRVKREFYGDNLFVSEIEKVLFS